MINRIVSNKFTIWLILLVALIIRIISLNQSLWLDEASTALAAKMSLNDLFTKYLPGDFHPPLYYVFMHFWVRIFGLSEISLRIPSIFFAIGAILLIYKIAKDQINNEAGVFAALFLSTSGLFNYYSQEARMYTMVTFFVCFAVFSFMKILKNNRAGNYVLYSLSMALILASDYLAIFIIPVFWLIGYTEHKNSNWWKKFVMSHIMLIMFLLIWIPIFKMQFSFGINTQAVSPVWSRLLGQLSFKNLLLIPVKFMLGRIGFDNYLTYSLVVLSSFLIFGIPLVRALKGGPLKIVIGWFTIPLILAVLVSVKLPVLQYFRLLFLLPAFYILIAQGLVLFKRQTKIILFFLILLINLGSTLIYLTNTRFQREDWRAAAHATANEIIIMPARSQTEALNYYGRNKDIVYFKDYIGMSSTVWLNRYVWQVFDPGDLAPKYLLSLGYNKSEERNFNGVVFWKYIK